MSVVGEDGKTMNLLLAVDSITTVEILLRAMMTRSWPITARSTWAQFKGLRIILDEASGLSAQVLSRKNA